MKHKITLLFVFLVIIAAIVWWRLHLDSESPHPEGRTSFAGQTNAQGLGVELAGKASSRQAAEILNHPSRWPAISVLANLTAEDEAVLLGAYRRKTNMQERVALVWSLAYIGADASFAAFRHTLTDEFAGQKLTGGRDGEANNEERVMEALVLAIGILAQRNDKAFDFLKGGTDPWFWQRNMKWKSGANEDEFGVLAEQAMVALGVSGRKEVSEILDTFSRQPLINETDPNLLKRTLNSGVVDAAFFNSIVREEGRDGFLQWYFTPKSDVFDEDGKFSRWCATDDGKKWRQWSAEFDKASFEKRKDLFEQFGRSLPK